MRASAHTDRGRCSYEIQHVCLSQHESGLLYYTRNRDYVMFTIMALYLLRGNGVLSSSMQRSKVTVLTSYIKVITRARGHVSRATRCTSFQSGLSNTGTSPPPPPPPPLPASYKHGVSRVYATPRPLGPAGGNTLDDITTARAHWPRDVAHLPNRLPVR